MTNTARPAQSARPELGAVPGDRVVVANGAMGTMLQASSASLDGFDGHEGCDDILNVTRPDIVRGGGNDLVVTGGDGARAGTVHVPAAASRPAPGPGPACPDLEDRATVRRLLRPERIGIALSEEFRLEPEHSADTLITFHPEAKYFSA